MFLLIFQMFILRMEMQKEKKQKNMITEIHRAWPKLVYLRKTGKGGISEHLISFSAVQGL